MYKPIQYYTKQSRGKIRLCGSYDYRYLFTDFDRSLKIKSKLRGGK